MSLQKALKYAISRKKFEILRMLKLMLGKTDDNDESESDDDDESESDNDGYEILKKLAPTVTDRESESDDDDSNDESNDKSESDDDDNDDESNSKSENDDVDKVSEPYNPYIDYYVNQALSSQTYTAKKLCSYCNLIYSEKTCPKCG